MQAVQVSAASADLASGSEPLQTAEGDVHRLAEVLDLEFETLKNRQLEAFEALQTEKNSLLERLSSMAAWVNAQPAVPALWQGLRENLVACREAHMRNAQLLQRQLQGVRGALQALQGEQAAPSVELYDRLGQVSRRAGNWYQHLA